MALDDFLNWQGKRLERQEEKRRHAGELNKRAAPAHPPPEPLALEDQSIEVQEFDGASTTVIERFRDAIARKFRRE